MLGAILVPVAFEEATRYIPPVPGNPNLIPALQWVVIGLLILVFLWFRPQGILPERRRADPRPPGATRRPASADGAPAPRPTADAGVTGAARAARRGARPRRRGASEIILECRGLGRSFDGVRAVDGVSMALPARAADRDHRTQRRRQVDRAGDARRHAAADRAVRSCCAETDVTALPAYRRARQGLVRTFQLASEFKRLTVMENLLAAIPDQRGETLPRRDARPPLLGRPGGARGSSGPRRRWSASACSRSPTATPAS